MDHWPTLDLLRHFLQDHQAGRDAPQLVTCIHHDAAVEIPLLKSGIERYDGQLYDLSADEQSWHEPPGPLNTDRAALIRGVTTAVPGALPGEIALFERQGRIVATIDGQPDAGANSPSLRTILRAAAVLASDALARTAITVFVAPIDASDPSRRELLWRLLTIDPNQLQLSGKRTIIPVLSGPLEPSIDLRRNVTVNYIARHDRILHRHPYTENAAFRTLSGHDGPIVLFLGAGASASAQISLGDAYRDVALRELLGTSDVTGLPDRFFEYLHSMDRFIGSERDHRTEFARTLTLERVLRETFHSIGELPRDRTRIVQTIAEECRSALEHRTAGHSALQDILRTRSRPIFVMTVNFDQLIETGIEDITQVLSTPEEFAAAEDEIRKYAEGDLSKLVPIFKLHGSIEDPTTLVASIDNTAAGLHPDVRDALNIVVEGGHVPWIWIGCSMRDRDINGWLDGIGSGRVDEWWVDPFPGSSLDAFFETYRQAAWDQQSRTLADRLIIDSADNVLARLRTHLAGSPPPGQQNAQATAEP